MSVSDAASLDQRANATKLLELFATTGSPGISSSADGCSLSDQIDQLEASFESVRVTSPLHWQGVPALVSPGEEAGDELPHCALLFRMDDLNDDWRPQQSPSTPRPQSAADAVFRRVAMKETVPISQEVAATRLSARLPANKTNDSHGLTDTAIMPSLDLMGARNDRLYPSKRQRREAVFCE